MSKNPLPGGSTGGGASPQFTIMTHLEKLALSSPAESDTVYISDTDKPEMYKNSRWHEFDMRRADYDVGGKVTNTRSGANVSGVLVTLNGNQTDTTDASGDYFIPNVPRGAAVTITASKSGYNNYSSTLNLTADTTSTNFTVARRTLSGTVTSSGGGALVGATVNIPSLSYTTTTDGSGNYSIIDVPDNSYTVTATHGSHTNFTSGTVVVSGDTDYDFTMTLATATVNGTITSNVTSQTIPSGMSLTVGGIGTTSGSSGAYSASSVPMGSQTVTWAGTYSSTYYNQSYFSASSNNPNINTNPFTHNFSVTPTQQAAVQYGYGSMTFPYASNSYIGNVRSWAVRFYVSQTVQCTGVSVYTTNFGGTYTPHFALWSEATQGLLVNKYPPSGMSFYGGIQDQLWDTPITLTTGFYYISAYSQSRSHGYQMNNLGLGSTFLATHPAVQMETIARYYDTDFGGGGYGGYPPYYNSTNNSWIVGIVPLIKL